MKCLLWLFLSLITLNVIRCQIMTRDGIVKTLLPAKNKTQDDVYRALSEDQLLKNVLDGERTTYLDDVLFTLKTQKWPAEETPCLNHIYSLIYSLQNFTLWAVWGWDAQTTEPQGILFGNRYQLGNFDQCMYPSWSNTHPDLKTKYCLVDIALERTDKTVMTRVEKPDPYKSALNFIQHPPSHIRPLHEVTWGACVPAVCAPRSVERLMAILLSRSHLGAAGMHAKISVDEPCQSADTEREYDTLFYAFFCLLGLLIAIALISTCLNQTIRLEADSKKTDFIRSFCLRENSLALLTMKKEGTEIFYGIRFLSICPIVLGHQIAVSNSAPISDGIKSDQMIQSTLGLFILHNDIFVETFFLLSGFLTITNLVRIKRLPNPLFIILKRYIRLVVAYAVVVFYVSAVFAHTGSGPMWNKAVMRNSVQCRESWWYHFLMISNYINNNNHCLVVSWYIPCDFHFFVVTLLVYCLYKRMPRLGLTIATILTAAAIVLPGVITYIKNLPPVQLFNYEFLLDSRASEEFNMFYTRSHTRYASYLVGCYSGYLFTKYKNNENMNRIKLVWSVLGTCAALVVMLVIMVTGSMFAWRSYHPLEAAVYAALNRPAWACGVAIIVLCCSFGRVPLVKSFLSWYPWVPLSRLVYGVYLTHIILIARNVFVPRNPQNNDYFLILNSTAATIFWSCVAALLIWLLAEAPANNLLAMCLKSKIKKLNLTEELNRDSLGVNTNLVTLQTVYGGHQLSSHKSTSTCP